MADVGIPAQRRRPTNPLAWIAKKAAERTIRELFELADINMEAPGHGISRSIGTRCRQVVRRMGRSPWRCLYGTRDWDCQAS